MTVNQKRIPFAVEAILIGNIFLGLAVAILSPTTVLSDSYILKSFTDFVASIIPGIDRLALVSAFPEVTRFTSAVLWVSVPLQLAISTYPRLYVLHPEKIRRQKTSLFFAWLLTPFLFFLFASVSVGEISHEKLMGKSIFAWGLRSVSESRIWLGILGGAVAYSAALTAFVFFAFWPRAWKYYFGKRP